MPTPEAQARLIIDELLVAAGWVVQDYARRYFGAARGVAIREFPLTTGAADYLLVVDRKAIGVVEAKKVGFPLIGVEPQASKYSVGGPAHMTSWHDPLPFLYQSTGQETRFTSLLDPEPRSRQVFAFHQPETLAGWASESQSLRARLREMPPVERGKLWPVQYDTLQKLERSLAADRPRALVHMATGSGKTFTAVSEVYRLIKHAKAERVLFLVDRRNLGKQAFNEFQSYETPDDGRKFTELYNVQLMTSNVFDPSAKVVITTVQRLYSMLAGEEELDIAAEEVSLWEQEEELAAVPKTVSYNPGIPIETFDFIIIDECHRSIYNLWRQVLEYFDAYLIGLTATPAKQTYAFFHQNLVQEYSRQDAVADGINVDGWVYRIRTAITEEGSVIEAGEMVPKRDRLTRAERWERLDEELAYAGSQLDRDVVSESQIRTVIRTFRDKLHSEIFPGREMVPKTLVFAKDDAHAEHITEIIRQEFGRGNEFCQKITYKVTGVSPEDLISQFRNSPMPRIAVTVDMVSTGTDIKPLEVLLFMRQVGSAVLFEQMLGRGTRVVDSDTLQAVSGADAQAKDYFVIVDAVGVVEHPRVDTQTMERKRSVSFSRLLEQVTDGAWDEETLVTLAGRLGRLARRASEAQVEDVVAASGGRTIRDLSHALLNALDPDVQLAAARVETGAEEPDEAAIRRAGERLRAEAGQLLADNPDLRAVLRKVHTLNEIVVDEVSVDRVREAGFSESATEMAREMVRSFEETLREHQNEIDALELLFRQPYALRGLTYAQLRELAAWLQAPPRQWTTERLWRAYQKLEPERVRGQADQRVVTNLISLVRHVVQPEEPLVPFPQTVQERYEAWLAQQRRTFTPEQQAWLDRIAEQIGVNLSFQANEVQDVFHEEGGILAARRVLGDEWRELIEQMNEALVA